MQPGFPLSVTTDDGGSAHTASSTDALSSDIICFTIWAGGTASGSRLTPSGSVKSSAYCASTRHSLFTLPSLPFFPNLMLCPPSQAGARRICAHNTPSEKWQTKTDRPFRLINTQTAFSPRMWSGRRPVKEDIHTLRKDAETGLRKRTRFGLAQKAGLFLKTVRRSRKPQLRFWFCIIVILLISEGGRRRTDYLRGIMLSSPHLFYSSSKIYPPVFFRRLKYTWVSPVFFCGNI